MRHESLGRAFRAETSESGGDPPKNRRCPATRAMGGRYGLWMHHELKPAGRIFRRGPWLPLLAALLSALGALRGGSESFQPAAAGNWGALAALVFEAVGFCCALGIGVWIYFRAGPSEGGESGGAFPRHRPRREWGRILLLSAASWALASRPMPPRRYIAPEGAKISEFEVLGAAEPGRRCRVWVRPLGSIGPQSADRLRLSLPPDPCAWAQGDRLVVPARRFHPRPSASKSDPARVRPVWVQDYAFVYAQSSGLWRGVALTRWRGYLQSFEQEGVSMVLSSVAGMRGALSGPNRQALRQAGLSHLSAISGLHVCMVASGGVWALRRLLLLWSWTRRRCVGRWSIEGGGIRRRETRLFLLSTGLVAAFVLGTGAAISAQRAALMWLASQLGRVWGEGLHSFQVLGWVAWVLLMIAPHWVAEASFQMSVLATALILSAPREQSGSLAISWRLTWGLAPLTLLHFGEGSLAGVLFNMVAIPLFAHWILPLGLGAFVLGLVGYALGHGLFLDGAQALLAVAGWGGELLLGVAQYAKYLPPGTPRRWLSLCLALAALRGWAALGRRRWPQLSEYAFRLIPGWALWAILGSLAWRNG